MGRRRQTKAREKWPVGLYARVRGGKTYYFYRDPVAKREIAVGIDLRAAITGIRIIEGRRAAEPVQKVISRIEKPRESINDFADWFENTHLPSRRTKTGKPLSKSTLDSYRLALNAVRAAWGSRDVASVDRAACVKLIEERPAEAGNKLRSILEKFFAQARARGLRDDNPVEGTVKRDSVIQRARLEMPRYKAIHAKAAPWLQRAMTLSLLSLQRPTDLCVMPRDAWAKPWWHVRQAKSAGRGYGLLRIKPHKELRAAIEACHAAQVEDCPYLLSREPEKRREAKGRGHWAQLSDEILSRAFAEVRDELTETLKWKWKGTPASYYEIKSLGARMYEEQGRPMAWIQSLLGHQDEGTTRIYLGRGEEKWVEVSL